jgi:hypothetical protein
MQLLSVGETVGRFPGQGYRFQNQRRSASSNPFVLFSSLAQAMQVSGRISIEGPYRRRRNVSFAWWLQRLRIDSFRLTLRERSGLEVRFEISKQLGRPLVQESLTNIHRHSESKTASIRIDRESNQITLDIRDQGKGMSFARMAEIQSGRSGVGIGSAGTPASIRRDDEYRVG